MRQPPFALRTHRLTARSVSTARNVFRNDLKTDICYSVIEGARPLLHQGFPILETEVKKEEFVL